MIFNFPSKIAGEVRPAAEGRIREKRKIENVTTDILYGEPAGQFGGVGTEPSVMEVYKAVAAGDSDDRPYDDANKPSLYAEFRQLSGFDPQTGENLGRYIDEVRKYHALRVAYFVLAVCENQIIGLDGNQCLRDGGHRVRAAMFMGRDEVWVDYPAPATA
jgi:hypothetical protein